MARRTSEVDKNMLEVEGASAIQGIPPGLEAKADISLTDLGKLSEFPDPIPNDNPTDGSGEFVVVIADFLSGAGEDDNFTKGMVRRLSRIVPGYADTAVDRETIKGRIKRLFENRAIRLATRDERTKDFVEVTLESESFSVANERLRRIELEEENEKLREALQNASSASVAASPTEAGKSEVAQEATTAEALGTKEEGETWE